MDKDVGRKQWPGSTLISQHSYLAMLRTASPTDLLQYDLHDHVKTFTVVNTFT
ncbi:hypothetical protein D083_0722 [Dickeya solani RNS 08.23.3.1.A]|nr:hypothetical protein D083_0722 [Dickeya solani RNS 08.23.3.1.A]